MVTEFDFSPPERASNLSVEVRSVNGSITLHVSGELDFSNALDLGHAFATNQLDGQPCVVLDLTDLTFCDASGVAALLKAHQSLHRAGRRLLIRGASGLPRRVFTITGVDQVLDLE